MADFPVPDLIRGLWQLPLESRHEVYQLLRRNLGLNADEPLLKSSGEQIDAFAQRTADRVQKLYTRSALLAPLNDHIELLVVTTQDYANPPDDDFMEAHRAYGDDLIEAGLPLLIVAGKLLPSLTVALRRSAREGLDPDQVKQVDWLVQRVLPLRIALMLESYLTRLHQTVYESSLEEFLRVTDMSRALYDNMR